MKISLLLLAVGIVTQLRGCGMCPARYFGPCYTSTLELKVWESGGQIHVAWPTVPGSPGAKLRIADDREERSIELSLDDLRKGETSFEHKTKKVAVTIEFLPAVPGKGGLIINATGRLAEP